ncbi:hypothetical protein G3M58_56555 [Streptomyces sp. SID7499]|uniref:Uncharacterized protein n=1 Tax=Streptomyces sp. SID7499 TaxID=2706086 RepID=A0A6G3XDI5_9ACTN|nr:hypothetical protein [Streptomyces sp. SID7499]
MRAQAQKRSNAVRVGGRPTPRPVTATAPPPLVALQRAACNAAVTRAIQRARDEHHPEGERSEAGGRDGDGPVPVQRRPSALDAVGSPGRPWSPASRGWLQQPEGKRLLVATLRWQQDIEDRAQGMPPAEATRSDYQLGRHRAIHADETPQSEKDQLEGKRNEQIFQTFVRTLLPPGISDDVPDAGQHRQRGRRRARPGLRRSRQRPHPGRPGSPGRHRRHPCTGADSARTTWRSATTRRTGRGAGSWGRARSGPPVHGLQAPDQQA